MTTDRIELLRILSNLDQSMAKVEGIIEQEQTSDGRQLATHIRAKLEAAHARTVEALRNAEL